MKKRLAIELALSLLCAALLSLSFSFSRCSFLAWLAFVPLFIALDKKNAKMAFWLAYFTGLLFWLGTIYWLANVTVFGQVILILYLALYFGIFGLLFSLVYLLPTSYYLLSISVSWVLLEYLRSHLLTGFPWSLLGYSQYLNLPLIQIADIGGVWLVSFLVMLVNATFYSVVAGKKKYLWLPVLCLAATLTYGYFRLSQETVAGNQASLRVSIIQGNIPQELKWNPEASEFIMDRYFNLTSEAKKETPDLIIWPEAALPVLLEEEPIFYERLQRYVMRLARPLLFGAVTSRKSNYYNSALLLNQDATLLARYDKLHLVPFGEYIPFRRTLNFLETIVPIGDITSGKEYILFTTQHQKSRINHQFGVLICFEDIFPELARRFINNGADFLVNITNDAWFGKTSEARQHLSASVFRAVENRVNLVRSANTGISAFINPRGRILSTVNDGAGNSIFIPGCLTRDIFLRTQRTFYGYFGDFFVAVCFLYFLYIVIYKRRMTHGAK